jgi:hypothetical protein
MSSNKVNISQTDILISAEHIGSGSAVALLRQGDVGLLAASGVFYGDPIYVGGYTHLCGYAYSDVDSATDGLILEQGLQLADFDNTTPAAATENITHSLYTIPGANIIDNAFNVQIVAPFARIIYINGAAAQTAFRLVGYTRVIRGL